MGIGTTAERFAAKERTMRIAALVVAGLAASLLGALPANATPLLTVVVTDNGTLVGHGSSSSGLLPLNITDSEFSTIDVTVKGVRALSAPDLLTVSADISTATGFTGTHTIAITANQIASIPVNPGTVTFMANGLAGAPGPTTQSLRLTGTPVAGVTFPAASGLASSSASTPAGNLTSETAVISTIFTAPGQTQKATVEFAATRSVIPEPLTLGVLGIGLISLGLARRFRQR
jgi:hypothetical protein